MLKFLYIGDMHEMESQPSSRIDNYEETVHKKRQEILNLAKKYNVNAILEGGDFLDRPKVSNSFLSFLMEEWGLNQLIMKDLFLKIKLGMNSFSDLQTQLNQTIPIIGVIGNHELIGGALDSYEKTSLAVLEESGFIHIVSKENPYIFSDNEIKVAITGQSYFFDIDSEDKSGYIIKDKLGDYHIHLVHGMLMNKSYGKMFKHTLIEDIAFETEADLTINGHDHTGYPLTTINNKMFINSGSIMRISATKKEIERKPKVLLITVSKEEGIQVQEIYLSFAEEGKQVLSRSHISDKFSKLNTEIKIEEIVENAKVNKGRNLNKIIENIGKVESIDKSIIDDCTDRIQKMQTLMEPTDNNNPDYFIESLELENFLSHKHSFFDFNENINILTGKSRAGKSAVLRALKELQECYLVNPRKAIFQNEEYFKITVKLSNGYIISRYVENKSKGRNLNGYYVYNPITKNTDFYNTKALPEIQKLFKFQPMKITDKKTINTNFMMQGEGWFFTENLSGQDRAKIVGYSFGAHIADAVVKEVNAESKECNSQIKRNEKELLEKENKIRSYDYLKELKEKLEMAKNISDKINHLTEKIGKVNDLLKQESEISSKILTYKNLLTTINSSHDTLQEKLLKLKEKEENLEKVELIWKKKNELLKNGKKIANLSHKFLHLEDVKIKLEKCIKVEQTGILEKGYTLTKRKETLEKSLKIMESLESNFLNLKLFNFDKLKELEIKLEKIRELKVKSQKILKEGISLKQEFLRKEQETKQLKETLKKELKSIGSCPVCHSILNEEKINQILEN